VFLNYQLNVRKFRLFSALNMHHIHKKTFFFNALQSTQDTALELLQTRTLPAVLVIAGYQHKGRGQRENIWHAPLASSVLCTLGLSGSLVNTLPVESLYWKIAVLTQLYLNTRYALFNNPIQIKWPNDLYIDFKKLGGILIEITWLGNRIQYVRIGLGLNVKGDFSALGHSSAQLSDFISSPLEPIEIAEGWADHILQELCYPTLHQDELKRLYENALMGKNSWHEYHLHEASKLLQIIGIDDFGNLLLKTSTNQLLKPLHHDLKWTWIIDNTK
jgi:BirA family biotin operon repressor/biotin-[acetyl-CoA-carboxylase] ligase